MQTKKERKPLYALLIEHREIPLLAVLVLLLIAVSIRVPGYLPKSYMNVLKNGSVNMVMSCGMLCVLLVGSIDISITAILGMVGIAAGLSGYLMADMNIIERVLAVVGGLLLIIPGTVTDIAGVVIVAIVVALQFISKKRAAKA